MIQVPVGQSQLSGWGHYAEPTVLFINKVPNPFMAGQTINLSATKSAGGTELHFSDGTVLKYEESGNLVPALEGVRVWSVPAEGTIVPNGLDYVTVYASYTTKHNKTLNAVPVKVPVASPSYMRIIVPEDPLIDEGWYLNTRRNWNDVTENGVQYRGFNSAFFYGRAFFAIYWVTKDGTVVKITTTENATLQSVSSPTFWQSSNICQVTSRKQSATFMRYRNISDEGTEITLEDAGKLTFSSRINNVTLTCETYVEINAIVDEGLFKLKTNYSGTESYTIDIEKNTKTVYKNGKVIFGRYADARRFFLELYLVYWDWMGYMIRTTSQTITLKDNASGNLRTYYRCRFGTRPTTWQAAREYSYKCENGEVKWTAGDIYYWPND